MCNKRRNAYMQNPVVTIQMEDGSGITAELYPDIAPNTVRNFISLAQSGFYDGLIFHRVSPGFMIQGGCPNGNGIGGPGYNIRGEFDSNGFKNDLRHTRGVISMARSSSNDSAGSQFFIMHEDATHLDGQYAAFGRVVSGMETVDAIASTPTNADDRPDSPQRIQHITVETHNEEYPPPEKA
jgi:peptidyl-prolyl cis-trans isomerase B (cyclophilin B)